jgi:hypothetical protein
MTTPNDGYLFAGRESTIAVHALDEMEHPFRDMETDLHGCRLREHKSL